LKQITGNPDQQERLVAAYKRADDWCDQQSQQLWPTLNRNTWTYTALYALVPIVLGWLSAYAIIAVVRWIKTGFRVPTSPG
jgi:ABC-type nitrate/sulfonate/bicarbonate transport system substrate-binding protein